MTSRTGLAAVEASQVLSLRTPVLEDIPKVELRQLRYFLAVAEELNFTPRGRADGHCATSAQPADYLA